MDDSYLTTYNNNTTRKSLPVFIGVSSRGCIQNRRGVNSINQILEELVLVQLVHATTAQLG
jgi:hypothetical protein